ncbi:MAG: phosphoserine aminotransferase [Candidatus Sumerlaeota bacterium]|nr:phosphoserine aminotransferase [Candidatus Sumerlaeota bacterium]
MGSTDRKVNFNAGPGLLPREVIEEVRENLLSLGSSGVGVMEHSHRGKEFVAVLEAAEAGCRDLLGLNDEWAVLFLSGGASTQFYMAPMNFLNGGTANYLDTGDWSAKAIKEAQRFGTVHIAASSKAEKYVRIPSGPLDEAPGAVYTHFTSNNTIYGTQWRQEPEAKSPLICDASSDIMSRPVALDKYAMIYAGAQKNLGPAGVTLVVVRKDFAASGRKDIPTMLRYTTHIEKESCFNTPPCLPIYVMALVFKWLAKKGGLEGIEKHNEAKAKVLYDCLDGSAFWTTPVEKASRSLMNVVWRLPSEELEKKLVADASAAGFHGIKGHRNVGGLRASIYNAMELADVERFVAFLKSWEKANG